MVYVLHRTAAAANCTFCVSKFTSYVIDLLDSCTLALDNAVIGRF